MNVVSRFFSPAMLFASAGWVHYMNSKGGNSYIVFPFVDSIFPETAGNPAAMGEKSEWILIGLGVLTLLNSFRQLWQDRQVDGPSTP